MQENNDIRAALTPKNVTEVTSRYCFNGRNRKLFTSKV